MGRNRHIWALLSVLAGVPVQAGCGDPGSAISSAADAGRADSTLDGPAPGDGGPVDLGMCSVESSPCDDGDPCTDNDRCVSGQCIGEPKSCETAAACTEAWCDPGTGQCRVAVSPDGAACDDGDLCTRTDRCEAGACVGSDALRCEAGSSCVVGRCDPDTGQCVGDAVPNGTACENACVAQGRCRDGACEGSQRICVGGPCEQTIECDPVVGCRFEVRPDGARCNDGNACTQSTTCQAGECTGVPLICLSSDPCMVASCDVQAGCRLESLEDGTACEIEGDLCVERAACESGVCTPVFRRECSVAPCMNDNVCDPNTGLCVPDWKEEGSACDDRNVCTEDTICRSTDCGFGREIPWMGTPCSQGFCFRDVTQSAGINFFGAVPYPHNHVSSAVFADFDDDDDPDLLLGTEATKFTLYRNDGNGRFTDVSLASGVAQWIRTSTAVHQGFAVADYDGDRDLDVYISNEGPNYLLRNDGSLRFTEVSTVAGVSGRHSWSVGSSFGDYDGDGDLDLYVGNYVFLPSSFPFHRATWNELYRNNGDGTFTEVTQAAGLRGSGLVPGTTLVTAFTDYDDDGDLDLLECNDFGVQVTPNKLYENQGNGQFQEVGAAVGADVRLYCMGIAVADFDRDEDLDYYFTSIGRSQFLRNMGGVYADVATQFDVGLANDECQTDQKRANWATAFFDFDHDGWEDLFVVGGYLRSASFLRNPFQQRNLLYKNRGPNQTFLDVSQSAGVASRLKARGAAFADYDLDGDVDVIVANMAGRPELLRNDSANLGSWLWVELRGRVSDASGLHSRLRAVVGNEVYVRELGNVPSYASSMEPKAHFGLAQATQVDRLEIRWLSGIEQTLLDLPVDRHMEVVEPVVILDRHSAPSSAQAGDTISIRFDLQERTGAARSVDLEVALHDGSGVVATARDLAVSVAASATLQRTVDLVVPTTASGDLRLVLTVRDPHSVDQDDGTISILP